MKCRTRSAPVARDRDGLIYMRLATALSTPSRWQSARR